MFAWETMKLVLTEDGAVRTDQSAFPVLILNVASNLHPTSRIDLYEYRPTHSIPYKDWELRLFPVEARHSLADYHLSQLRHLTGQSYAVNSSDDQTGWEICQKMIHYGNVENNRYDKLGYEDTACTNQFIVEHDQAFEDEVVEKARSDLAELTVDDGGSTTEDDGEPAKKVQATGGRGPGRGRGCGRRGRKKRR